MRDTTNIANIISIIFAILQKRGILSLSEADHIIRLMGDEKFDEAVDYVLGLSIRREPQ